MRLVPRDGYSWTGYFWLVYLGTPIWYAVSNRTAPGASPLALAIGIAVFLPLYFWGYWLQGPRAFVPIAAIALLGVYLTRINAGGWVFFVYAASFAGRVGRPAIGVRTLVALIAVVGLETWLVGLHAETWGPAVPLIMFIGGIGVVFAELGRTQAQRRLAAEEDARYLAVVAERERIGRDLHDLLGQTLSVITLKAELASKLLSRDPERSGREMVDIEHISREALAEVRRAVGGYRQASLTGEMSHARSALETAGVTFEAHVAQATFRPAEEQTLALAVRQGVTNVIRHAQARHCEVRLTVEGAVARLEISDDGIGGDAREGTGIAGMRERIGALGGRMSRDSVQGTRLTVTLPLLAADRPALAEDLP